jgi:hypothetical protein
MKIQKVLFFSSVIALASLSGCIEGPYEPYGVYDRGPDYWGGLWRIL